jgi:hypothetical protein
MLHEIVHDSSLHRSTLRIRESIERMTMRLIEPIAHLYEDPYITLFCYDIDLSSLDCIVGIDDLISLLLKIADRSQLSLISCGAARWGHRFMG